MNLVFNRTIAGERAGSPSASWSHLADVPVGGPLDGLFLNLRSAVRTLRGRRIAMLGYIPEPLIGDLGTHCAAFAARLQASGCALVAVGDCGAQRESGRIEPAIDWAEDLYEAMNGADALVMMRSFPALQHLDLIEAKHRVRRPILADACRNLSPAVVQAAGFRYVGCESGIGGAPSISGSVIAAPFRIALAS